LPQELWQNDPQLKKKEIMSIFVSYELYPFQTNVFITTNSFSTVVAITTQHIFTKILTVYTGCAVEPCCIFKWCDSTAQPQLKKISPAR
jgi:hypothetical protein